MQKVLASVSVATLLVAVAASSSLAGDLKSGLQPGDFPGAFNVTDCTGEEKGNTLCYRCKFGPRPVVTIFTRTMDDSVISLIKKVDAEVASHQDEKMAAFVVLLTDKGDSETANLEEIAKKNDIKHVPLTTYEDTTGPGEYKIAADAEVTVLMWSRNEVKVSEAFGKGEFGKANVAQVVSKTDEILN